MRAEAAVQAVSRTGHAATQALLVGAQVGPSLLRRTSREKAITK